jgi:two-component system, cell cycle sensor histidine kinase and response regulator CckA
MPLTPTETILVVDDDAMVRKYVAVVLANSGYKVYAEHSGERGFVCFMEHADDIDLVFTDIVMPEMNGPEMVRRIQQYRPHVKVLFMTGYHATDGAAAHPPCCGILQKPFTTHAMLASIQDCLCRPG